MENEIKICEYWKCEYNLSGECVFIIKCPICNKDYEKHTCYQAMKCRQHMTFEQRLKIYKCLEKKREIDEKKSFKIYWL